MTGKPSDREIWNEFVARAADERARSASKKKRNGDFDEIDS